MGAQLKQRHRRCIPMELARQIFCESRSWLVTLQRCSSLWLMGFILSAIWNPAAAATHDDGISYLIGMMHGHVDRAVLYMAPYPGALTSDPQLNEEGLPAAGCKYDIGQDGTDELIDILKDGHINSNGPESITPVADARTAIFIYRNKKRVMTMLVLADPLPNEDFMRGVWNRGNAITTGPRLQAALRAFAKKLTPVSTHPSCTNN